jgi:integrase
MSERNPTAVWIVTREGKRGKAYRLRWIDPRTGKWCSEAAGRDLAYARTRREEIRRDLRDGLAGKLPTVTVEELAERLDSLMAGKAPDTITRTKDTLRAFEAACHVGHITNIDRGAVMSFRAKRLAADLATGTVNRDMRLIRSALSYATDGGLLRANPLLRWKGLMLRQPDKVVRVIEEVEFAKLTGVCDNVAVKALLTVAYRQGLRRMELANLRWAAIDLEGETLHVVNVAEAGEFTKSRKNRSLPMHPLVKAALADLWAVTRKKVEQGQAVPASAYVFSWPDGRPFEAGWLSREFTSLAKKAGIPPCTLHDCRRSFSTQAQRAGIDRSVVKDLGGWSSVSVVEKHYSGEISAVYRQAMKRIASVTQATA